MNGFQRMSLAGVFLFVHIGLTLAEEPAVEVLRSRTYVTRGTGPLDADVYVPHGAGPFPGMLVVHGGAWRIGSRAQLAGLASKFAENGYTAVAISYRLAPQSTFPAQIYDSQAAVRWMRTHASEFKIDPLRIGGFGYSAGGHLVALLGTLDDDDFKEDGIATDAPSARLECVLAGGAPCDFREMPASTRQLAYWLGGTRSDKSENYRDASPANFITADDPPMFFFSGEQDLLVPISSPRKMVESLRSAGVTAEMYAVNDAGHLQTLFDRGVMEHALAFADRYLKAGEVKQSAGGRPSAADGARAPAREEVVKATNSKDETRDGQ